MRLALSLLTVALLVGSAMASGPSAPPAPAVGPSITFESATAREEFRRYVELLHQDPQKFAREIATVQQLGASDVTYVVVIGGSFESGIEGTISTDGERIFINIAADPRREEALSLSSRLAHELEHARQFDSGELAFTRDRTTGRWEPSRSSYDIGDEVKAWEAQLRASTVADFWTKRTGEKAPSFLRSFADAASPTARAELLKAHGYEGLSPVLSSDVIFRASSGYHSGQLVRGDGSFFARVSGLSTPLEHPEVPDALAQPTSEPEPVFHQDAVISDTSWQGF